MTHGPSPFSFASPPPKKGRFLVSALRKSQPQSVSSSLWVHEGAGGGRPGYAQREHGEGATEASKQQSNDHFAIGCRYPNRWETRLESVGAWGNIVRLHV
jgi:hypothetical protein